MEHPKGCGCLECPDPHEDWYFSYPLPPDWRQMTQEERQAIWKAMDAADQATVMSRMRQRKLVAQGRFLAQQEKERDRELTRRLYHGFALDAAMYRIMVRAAGQPQPVTASVIHANPEG